MKQHIVRIAALGLSTTAIIGAGSTFTAGYAATPECTAGSSKLIETIAAVTHTESRYAKTVPGAHHDEVTHVVHHEAETHEVVAPGGYAYTQHSTGKIQFKDSDSWNPGKGWDRTPSLDQMVTIVDKDAWDEVVVDTVAYDEPDTVLYYTGKPAGSTDIADAAWVRYAPTGWSTKVATQTITEAPETYVCDFIKPVTTLLNPEPLVRPGHVFDLETTDNHLVTKTVGNIYRSGELFKSFQSPTGSLSVPVNLPDGAYTLRYNGLDSVGNVASTSTYDFVVDGTGPTVTDKGTAGAAAQSKSFKLFDARRVDKVTINGETKDLTNNNWSDVNDIKPGRFGAVEGKNTLIAYDEAGNASSAVEFVLDTTGPLVTEKEGSSESSRSFSLDDGALGAKVAGVRVNGTDFALSANRWSDANALSLGSFWGVHAGENTLIAYDTLGNETTVTFTIAAPMEDEPGANPQPEPEPETGPGTNNGSDNGSSTEPGTVTDVDAAATSASKGAASAGTPSDAGPVATTAAVTGPKAWATTALAPELARAPFAAAGTPQGAVSTVALTEVQTGEEVDTVRIAAAAPVAVDESLPGLGIAVVAGGGVLALAAVFGLRTARRRA